MISNFLLVFVTCSGLLIVGEYSIVLGVIVFSVLTYFCAKVCLLEAVENGIYTNANSNRFYYLYMYAYKIGIVAYRIIYSVRWVYFFIQIRKLVYVFKILKGNNVKIHKSYSTSSDSLQQGASKTSLKTCDSENQIDAEIKTIVNCILNHYIQWWYQGSISEDQKFITELKYAIRDTLSTFFSGLPNLKRKQLCCKIFQLYFHFLYHYKEALNKVTSKENLLQKCLLNKREISENFKMQHWAMRDKTNERFYLQSIVTSLLEAFGPLDFLKCPILHSFVAEILTHTVLYPLVNILSDPNYLNNWILKLLQEIMKGDNELSKIISENKMCSHTHVDLIKNSSWKYPVILLSRDEPSNSQENPRNFENIDISNEYLSVSEKSSKLSESTRKSSTDSEIFKSSVNDFSVNNSETEYSDHCNFNGAQLLFPIVNTKSISNDELSLCTEELSDLEKTPSEITRMTRSRSADFIRQTPLYHLMPLSRASMRSQNRDKNSQFKSTKTLHSFDVEVAEEAKELPQLFTNLKVIDTEVHEDGCHTPYTLYCIQYSALFQDSSIDNLVPVYVRHFVNTKRRFREFLALQSRLENNPSLKRCLKGIKGPSIWKTIPFAQLDKKNVAERKPFLEKYLQDLCSHPEICQSDEFQEFLAYGSDASIAFVKKPGEGGILRIDKMIVKSVKGAFDLFRTALPSPSPSNCDVSALRRPLYLFDDEKDLNHEESASYSDSDVNVYLLNTSHTDIPLFTDIEQKISIFNDDDDDDSSSTYDDMQISKSSGKLVAYRSYSINENSCNCKATISFSESLKEENMLANVVIDSIFESLHKFPGPKITSNVELVKFLCGSIFDKYMEDKLNEINEEICSQLLHLFHKAMWPEENNKKTDIITNLPLVIAKYANQKQKEILNSAVYGQLIRHLVGSDEISSAIELLIGSFQNESLNRCFLFYSLDTLTQYFCSLDTLD